MDKDCSFCGQPLPTLAEFMARQAKQPRPAFRPCWLFNSAGQQIEVYWSNEPAFAEQLNENMSLYRSQETKEIIGCVIYGVAPVAVGTLKGH